MQDSSVHPPGQFRGPGKKPSPANWNCRWDRKSENRLRLFFVLIGLILFNAAGCITRQLELPPSVATQVRYKRVQVYADRPPWTGSGLSVSEGDTVKKEQPLITLG